MPNLGFETEDPGVPGKPEDWTLVGTWSPVPAQFALAVGETPNENFEDWIPGGYQLILPPPLEVFDEDFENWVFPGFVGSLPTPLETFDEDFENWVAYQFTFPVPLQVLVEDFELWIVPVLTFPTPFQVFNEDFESVKLPLTIVVDDVLNLITTSMPHGLASNDRVRFSTTSRLPAPISPATDFFYFVLSVPNATQITISATFGGPVLDITDLGVGVHQIGFDPDLFWTFVNDSV